MLPREYIILQAVRSGDPKQLTRRLKEYPRLVNTVLDAHGSFIHEAAAHGHNENIKVLLAFGCKGLDVPTRHGRTPMHCALFKGHSLTVELLYRFGGTLVDVESLCKMRYNNPMTLDIIACIETVIRIGGLGSFTRISYRDVDLHYPCIFFRNEVINLLVHLGITVDLSQETSPKWNEAYSRKLRKRIYFSESLLLHVLRREEHLANRKRFRPRQRLLR